VLSAGYRLTLSGATYKTAPMPIRFLLARRSRNRAFLSRKRDANIHWLRPFTVDTPACLPTAFTSVTTKCCWTTRSICRACSCRRRDARADVWMGMPHGFPEA